MPESNTYYCKRCGGIIDNDARYCPYCKKRVRPGKKSCKALRLIFAILLLFPLLYLVLATLFSISEITDDIGVGIFVVGFLHT